jgi:hypothetical protein
LPTSNDSSIIEIQPKHIKMHESLKMYNCAFLLVSRYTPHKGIGEVAAEERGTAYLRRTEKPPSSQAAISKGTTIGYDLPLCILSTDAVQRVE